MSETAVRYTDFFIKTKEFDLLKANVAAWDGNARDVDEISIIDAIDIAIMTSTFLVCASMLRDHL